MKNWMLFSLAVFALAVGAKDAAAVPILQVYVEGGTYNQTTESWEVTSDGPIRLWTIGNVSGPGGSGAISDVRLAISYDSTYSDLAVALTPSTTGGFNGVADPSTPDAPQLIQTVTDGSRPLLGDGSEIGGHGIYGAGTTWQEFMLGDYTLTDSAIGDFMNAFPTEMTANAGQINVYEVNVATSLGSSVALHFDLYDSVLAENNVKYVFAPFSHDGDGTTTPGDGTVPEPAGLALGGLALASLLASRRRKH